MSHLDFHSLILAALVVGVLTSIWETALWRAVSPFVRGARYWGNAPILSTLGLILIALRGSDLGGVAIVLGNGFTVASAMLVLCGLRVNFGYPITCRRFAILLAGHLLVHAWFTFASPSMAMRAANTSLCLGYLALEGLWFVARTLPAEERQFARRLIPVYAFTLLICATVAGAGIFVVQVEQLLTKYAGSDFGCVMILVYQPMRIILVYELSLLASRRLLSNLNRDRRKFRAAFRVSPYGLVLSTANEGRILEVNPGFARLTGMSKESLIGRTTTQIGLWRSDQERTTALAALRRDGDCISGRMKAGSMAEGGKLLDYHVVFLVIDGIPHTLTHLEDVTERCAHEEELKKHRYSLERMIEQRTTDLASAKERAEASDQAKETLLSAVSHEFRNPLNSLMLTLDLMRSRPEDSGSVDRLETAVGAAVALRRSVEQILEYTNLRSSIVTPKPSTFLVLPLLETMAAQIAPRAQCKAVSIEVTVPSAITDVRITTDRDLLVRAVSIILDNAVDFTAMGTVTLSVSLERHLSAACLAIAVADTGKGFPEGQASRMFAPFERADQSLNRASRGLGLGLATLDILAQALGCKVQLQDNAGGGAIVRLVLPLPESEEMAHFPSTDDNRKFSLARTESRTGIVGARILLAEDDRLGRLAIKAMLASFGATVDTAENGEQAVEQFDARSHDLVLMDLQMPDMNGIEAARLIRYLPGGRDVPIIALSGNAFDSDRQRCLAAGMVEHLAKPILGNELRAVLERWLAESRKSAGGAVEVEAP